MFLDNNTKKTPKRQGQEYQVLSGDNGNKWKAEVMKKGRNIKRVILIIIDGVGVGELPDSSDYNDQGSNSLKHVADFVGGLNLPNLRKMGLGNITEIYGVKPVSEPIGAYGKMQEASRGKDSIIGHWEIIGIYSSKPLPLFPHGFPKNLISSFENEIGCNIIGNKVASGTEIIEELGDEHVKTGSLIVYTSADSVFQIAAHEEIVPIPDLYRICESARKLLTGEYGVGRVIARPFLGTSGNYWRTGNRRDWSIPPPGLNLLVKLYNKGYTIISVGKIDDIFAHRYITISAHTLNNKETMEKIVEFLKTDFHGILFANLIDFDMLYGHRNNPEGYAKALEEFDDRISELMEGLGTDDILIITSDHGNDPVTPSTDHSREYVPLLISGKRVESNVDLGIRETFADVGASIADLFHVGSLDLGKTFINEILRPDCR